MNTSDSQTGSGLRVIAHGYIDALNAHSAAAVYALFAPQAVLIDPMYPQGIAGKAIVETTQRMFDLVPDIKFAIESVVEGSDGQVVCEWVLNGTATVANARRPISLRGCDVFHVEAGKIARLHAYFDRQAIAEQLGGTQAAAA
jgi:steroid delta-isomerase-like uncharacterized protein